MRILWTRWELISRTSATGRAFDPVYQDPYLSELQHDLTVTRWILLSGFVIGLLTLLLIWILQVVHDGFTIFFWALACYAGGSLLGFLFGVPRVLQKDTQPNSRPQNSESLVPESSVSYQMVINTNLDDISDWLTKIVVGVGLFELQKIPHLLNRVAGEISGEIGTPHVSFVIAVLLYFSAVGFMGGYLTTRMFFQRAFRLSDLAAEGALGAKRTDSITSTKTVTVSEQASPAVAGR